MREPQGAMLRDYGAATIGLPYRASRVRWGQIRERVGGCAGGYGWVALTLKPGRAAQRPRSKGGARRPERRQRQPRRAHSSRFGLIHLQSEIWTTYNAEAL